MVNSWWFPLFVRLLQSTAKIENSRKKIIHVKSDKIFEQNNYESNKISSRTPERSIDNNNANHGSQ